MRDIDEIFEGFRSVLRKPAALIEFLSSMQYDVQRALIKRLPKSERELFRELTSKLGREQHCEWMFVFLDVDQEEAADEAYLDWVLNEQIQAHWKELDCQEDAADLREANLEPCGYFIEMDTPQHMFNIDRPTLNNDW
ncbi:MAG: hypothetical protein WA001_04780 [Patescibacteria group bacterium]